MAAAGAAAIEALEDADDVRAARAALADPEPSIPMSEVLATYWRPSARKELDRLDRPVRARILRKVDALADSHSQSHASSCCTR